MTDVDLAVDHDCDFDPEAGGQSHPVGTAFPADQGHAVGTAFPADQGHAVGAACGRDQRGDDADWPRPEHRNPVAAPDRDPADRASGVLTSAFTDPPRSAP